jgi:hypothetical protein
MITGFITLAGTVPKSMLEINPVLNKIKDMQGRVDALRGYL